MHICRSRHQSKAIPLNVRANCQFFLGSDSPSQLIGQRYQSTGCGRARLQAEGQGQLDLCLRSQDKVRWWLILRIRFDLRKLGHEERLRFQEQMPQGKKGTTIRKSKWWCFSQRFVSKMFITNFVYSVGETHREEEVSGT